MCALDQGCIYISRASCNMPSRGRGHRCRRGSPRIVSTVDPRTHRRPYFVFLFSDLEEITVFLLCPINVTTYTPAAVLSLFTPDRAQHSTPVASTPAGVPASAGKDPRRPLSSPRYCTPLGLLKANSAECAHLQSPRVLGPGFRHV